jgi:5-aminopentanamidase
VNARGMNQLRISLLHLALKPGALELNTMLVERGIRIAAAQGADWVVTPELSISGYQFVELIGTDWIDAFPDAWTRHVCGLAGSLKTVVFLSHVERGPDGKLYNSTFMIGSEGSIVGRHQKVNVQAEPWASAGTRIAPTEWNGLKLGMLICSDSYTKEIAAELHAAGAQLLLSPCAWGPGLYGPEGEWELRSAETGLALIICNRTGSETSLSFSRAESLVIKNGQRLLVHSSERSGLLTFDWDLVAMAPRSKEFATTYLD